MALKISFYTQGCRLNQAETATIEKEFQGELYQIVDFNTPADLVIINTCTVTENGDTDARRLVQKAVKLNPTTKIALVGCLAQVQKNALSDLSNVKWIVGNQDKFNIEKIIQAYFDEEQPVLKVDKPKAEPFIIKQNSIDPRHTRANLKIQDGCDFYCAFCVIPFARGPARSRVMSDIIREAIILTEAGHQELVLTGINIGTYHYDGQHLLDVIRNLEKMPKLKRIRISSIEPTTIPIDLLDHMAKSEKLCPYLHIPIQSGCNEILEAMARKYNLEEFDQFIRLAKEKVPDICVGTDVIVGFPGETEALYEKTKTYLKEAPIDYFHVFSYSERSLARSKKRDGKVSSEVIKKRSAQLRELSNRKRQLYYQQFIGTKREVLFEQNKKGKATGHCDNFIKVSIETNEHLKNQFRHVTLINYTDTHMMGTLTDR